MDGSLPSYQVKNTFIEFGAHEDGSCLPQMGVKSMPPLKLRPSQQGQVPYLATPTASVTPAVLHMPSPGVDTPTSSSVLVNLATSASTRQEAVATAEPWLLQAPCLSAVSSATQPTTSASQPTHLYMQPMQVQLQSPTQYVLCPQGQAAILPTAQQPMLVQPGSPSVLSPLMTCPQGSHPVVPKVQRQPESSMGSNVHGSGQCKPCAWFWKDQGCQNGKDCQHCHTCDEGELKRRKKAKIATMGTKQQ